MRLACPGVAGFLPRLADAGGPENGADGPANGPANGPADGPVGGSVGGKPLGGGGPCQRDSPLRMRIRAPTTTKINGQMNCQGSRINQCSVLSSNQPPISTTIVP